MKKLNIKESLGAIKEVFRSKVVTKINELIDRNNGVGTGNYKRYVAIVSQSSTDAPTATVLENTFNAVPAWSYGATGSYNFTLSGAFQDVNKLFVIISNPGKKVEGDSSCTAGVVQSIWATDSIINFQTNFTGSPLADSVMSYCYIEVRVYN